MEGVTGCCRGVSREVSVAGEVSREVSGGCGGGCDEVLPRCVTGGVGCVWGRCVTRGVGVRTGVGGVMRCRGVSREVSVTGEVSAPADGSHGSVGGGVDGLRAVEPQGGSQWRGADQAQRPGRRGPQHAKRGHTAQYYGTKCSLSAPDRKSTLSAYLLCRSMIISRSIA